MAAHSLGTAIRSVQARAQQINKDVSKDQDKVVNSLKVGKTEEFSKTVRCSCFCA